jgi:Tfp pilus assembly protein PilO
MQFRDKILLCGAPYLVAGFLWFGVTSPALVADQEKNGELAEKQKEHIDLTTRLSDVQRQQEERARLDREIGDLRGSVPKSPDIDILLIDLEKMCLSSNMDIVGIEPPEKEKEKLAQESEPTAQAGGAPQARPGLALGQQQLGQALAGNVPGRAAGAAKAGPGAPVETGLSRLVKQVTVTGDYPGLVELMKKLESYQRVISVNQVEAEVPQEVSQKKAAVRHLMVSFLMTAYYLP